MSTVKPEHTSTSSLLQISPHAVVVGEYWRCGSNFSSHVANGGHSCTQRETDINVMIYLYSFPWWINTWDQLLTSTIKSYHSLLRLAGINFCHWPVQEMESTPGPWYSTMAPVPPFTVRIPATFRMTSLGDVQPERVPVSFTPITLEEEKKKEILVKTFGNGKEANNLLLLWREKNM